MDGLDPAILANILATPQFQRLYRSQLSEGLSNNSSPPVQHTDPHDAQPLNDEVSRQSAVQCSHLNLSGNPRQMVTDVNPDTSGGGPHQSAGRAGLPPSNNLQHQHLNDQGPHHQAAGRAGFYSPVHHHHQLSTRNSSFLPAGRPGPYSQLSASSLRLHQPPIDQNDDPYFQTFTDPRQQPFTDGNPRQQQQQQPNGIASVNFHTGQVLSDNNSSHASERALIFLPDNDLPSTSSSRTTARLQQRNAAFAGHRGKTASKRVEVKNDFTQTIVLLPQWEPSEQPTAKGIIDLEACGMGARELSFNEKDSASCVNRKIYSAFEILSHISGGIQMYVKDGPGNTKKLYPTSSPVVNGKQLKDLSKSRVFVAPILDEKFPAVIQTSTIIVKCPNCQLDMDQNFIRRHHDICRSPSIIHPQPSTSGCLHPNGNQTQLSISSSGDEGDFINAEDVVPHPSYSEKDVTESLRILQDYKENFMVATDHEARHNRNLVNKAKFNRCSVLDDAHDLAQTTEFMSKIRCPLVVEFENEAGVDYGGLRKNLLSLLLDRIEEGLETLHLLYEEGSGIDETLTPRWVFERIFTFGVFSSFAILQETYCEPFILQWLDKLAGKEDHPFILGLERFGIVKLISENPKLRSLFSSKELTADFFLSMFERAPSSDLRSICRLENGTFWFFFQFVKDVFDGKVTRSTGKLLSIRDLVGFVTGSFYIPRSPSTISLSFIGSPEGAVARPEVSTCFASLIHPYVHQPAEMREIWLSALDDSTDEFHRV